MTAHIKENKMFKEDIDLVQRMINTAIADAFKKAETKVEKSEPIKKVEKQEPVKTFEPTKVTKKEK